MDPMRTHLASLILAASVLTACGSENEEAALTEEERLAMPANAAYGRKLFRQCAVCHEATEGTGHRVGPNLWDVVGAEAGRHPDFRYSRALQNADVVWNPRTLDAYIEEPQAVIEGGRMAYDGNDSEADRRDIIAFLKTLTDE